MYNERWTEKPGIMEDWNNGMLGKTIKTTFSNPLFHHSIIP
jgi:hypothetical protein